MNAARSYDPAHYQTRLGLSYTPSRYQAAIFDWVSTGYVTIDGENLEPWSVVVDAVAGSGKSTTSSDSMALEEGDVLACAFNRHSADDLAHKLEGTRAKATTVHGHGLSAVRWHCFSRNGLNGAVEVEAAKKSGDKADRKYVDMLTAAGVAIVERADRGERVTLCGEWVTPEQVKAIRDDGWPVNEAAELLGLAQLFLIDFDAADFERGLDWLAGRYHVGIDALLWPHVVAAIRNALRRGCTPPRTGKWLVNFTDMIWLPNVLGLRPKQYDLVVVDECQDISTAARRLLIASVKRGGRMMWVGDRKQAINAFAGADAESFDAIIRETDAVVLPLSVCYRCPTSHLARAREWRPDIEARPGAPVGSIRQLDRIDYVDVAERGDLVICRRTAPLIGLCFELIAAGTSACVRGRADMSKGLVKLVTRASKGLRGDAWSERFSDQLDAVEKTEREKVTKRSRDAASAAAAIDALGDRIECVRVIARSSGATSAAEATAAIERIFADKDAAVTLSTVHRSKGDEADRVVILEYDRLISTRAQSLEEIEQEWNGWYVAQTRSRREIIEIPAPKRERGEG
jgi:DNA helicase-2/ATP-dependent DNA helicase PcrA